MDSSPPDDSSVWGTADKSQQGTIFTAPLSTARRLVQPRKAAKRHRLRHVPVGPAGIWFQADREERRSRRRLGHINSNDNNHDGEGDNVTGDEADVNFSQDPLSHYDDSGVIFYSEAWENMQKELEFSSPRMPAYLSAKDRYKACRPNVPPQYVMVMDVLGGKADWKLPEGRKLLAIVHSIETLGDNMWVTELLDVTGATVPAWIEPKLVEQEQQRASPKYVRSGIVWMLRDVAVVLETKKDILDDHADEESDDNTNFKRMVLVGEHNIERVWLPKLSSRNEQGYHEKEYLENPETTPLPKQKNTRKREGRRTPKATQQQGTPRPRNELFRNDSIMEDVDLAVSLPLPPQQQSQDLATPRIVDRSFSHGRENQENSRVPSVQSQPVPSRESLQNMFSDLSQAHEPKNHECPSMSSKKATPTPSARHEQKQVPSQTSSKKSRRASESGPKRKKKTEPVASSQTKSTDQSTSQTTKAQKLILSDKPPSSSLWTAEAAGMIGMMDEIDDDDVDVHVDTSDKEHEENELPGPDKPAASLPAHSPRCASASNHCSLFQNSGLLSIDMDGLSDDEP